MSKGKAWKYGDDVNTDVIFPGRYTYVSMEPEEMAKHALEDLDPQIWDKSYPEAIQRTFDDVPDKVALAFQGLEITFGQIDKYANAFSNMLMGLKKVM